jgi:hypothetical protein
VVILRFLPEYSFLNFASRALPTAQIIARRNRLASIFPRKSAAILQAKGTICVRRNISCRQPSTDRIFGASVENNGGSMQSERI